MQCNMQYYFCLLCSFSSVALSAQHLAVLNDGSTTFTPRGDVVTFHEFVVELFAAERTDVLLLFPHSQFDVFGKCTKVEIMLVTRQHIGDDACLLLYLAVTHQGRDTLS